MLPIAALNPAARRPVKRDCSLEPLTLGHKTGATGPGTAAAVEADSAAILWPLRGILPEVGGQGPSPRLDTAQRPFDLALSSGASGNVPVH